MEEQSIKILEGQIAKLDNKEFDLEAWKSSSISLLGRIFGKDDNRLKQIKELKIDYGSWALRDASSSYNPVKSCKKIGREIFETSIDELKAFGVAPTESTSGIMSALGDEFTGTQIKELKVLLNSSKPDSAKKKGVLKLLNTLSKRKSVAILVDLLLADKRN